MTLHFPSPMAKAAAILFLLLIPAGVSAQPSASPGDMAGRRMQALSLSADHPALSPVCPQSARADNRCLWGSLDVALAKFYLARSPADIAQANAGLQQSMAVADAQIGPQTESPDPDERSLRGGFDFHFLTSGLMSRVYFQFGPDSGPSTARLTPDNAKTIASLFWKFAQSQCRVADADPAKTWHIQGTENHNIMSDASCLYAADILSRRPVCGACTYDDGSSPRTQAAAWAGFLKEYIRQRIMFGGFVEFYSPYYRYTMQNFYDFADFAADPQLRRMASGLLDVWWAEWAEEQVNGVDGGGKTRLERIDTQNDFIGSEVGWVYFGLGAMPRTIQEPGLMIMLTSAYAPPPVVAAIAAGPKGRYEVRANSPGLLASPAVAGANNINAEAGGILRYSYVTPSFVMGSDLIARRPFRDWATFSSQDRWSGVALVAEKAFVYAQPSALNVRTKGYNDVWGVQSAGTQIMQKLSPPFSHSTGAMAVHIGNGLSVEHDGAWSFIDASAYIAFRPAIGGYVAGGGPQVLTLEEQQSPVILLAAEKSDYPGFNAFKSAILSAPLAVGADDIRFTGPGKTGTLDFFYKSGALPQIDGKALSLTPRYSVDSPFLQGAWGSARITIQMGQDKLVRDFGNGTK